MRKETSSVVDFVDELEEMVACVVQDHTHCTQRYDWWTELEGHPDERTVLIQVDKRIQSIILILCRLVNLIFLYHISFLRVVLLKTTVLLFELLSDRRAIRAGGLYNFCLLDIWRLALRLLLSLIDLSSLIQAFDKTISWRVGIYPEVCKASSAKWHVCVKNRYSIAFANKFR